MKKIPDEMRYKILSDIRAYFLTGKKKLKDIAAEYCISESAIKNIHIQVTYKHTYHQEDDNNYLYNIRMKEAEERAKKSC